MLPYQVSLLWDWVGDSCPDLLQSSREYGRDFTECGFGDGYDGGVCGFFIWSAYYWLCGGLAEFADCIVFCGGVVWFECGVGFEVEARVKISLGKIKH